MTTATRTARRDEEGTSLLEFAAVFPIFVALLWGIITYGVVFSVDHTLNAASSEGARAAVAARDAAEAETIAEAAATEQLQALGGNAATAVVDAVTQPCGAPATAQCIVVTVTYPWGTDPVIPEFPLVAGLTPDTIDSVSTIQLSLSS